MTTEDKVTRFMNTLLRLQHDRGAMACLRKGICRALEYNAWPYLAEACNLESERERTIAIYVAAFFALHPNLVTKGNFGGHLRALAASLGGDGFKTLDLSVRRLIKPQSILAVCRNLHNLVYRLKSAGIPVNFWQLYSDLLLIDVDNQVRIRWASSYGG